MENRKKAYLKYCVYLALLVALVYGAGRLYFRVTGGFTEGNIKSELPYDERWVMPPLPAEQKALVNSILSQDFHYLGKGCQSYVFLSADKKYVIKFIKYQRFRPQQWINYFSFIPAVEKYQVNKTQEKRQKLDNLLAAWKLSYEHLKPETGLVYVHLNKSQDLNKNLVIYDKLGLQHTLDLDQHEFLVQKRADMLTKTITTYVDNGQVELATSLVDRLIQMILSEYARGFGDNDHALMQNTGVLDGEPIHIDVGQFVQKESFKEPKVYHQELFSKTFKFRSWLNKHYPILEQHLNEELTEIIGPAMKTLKPQLKNMDECASAI